MGMKKLGGWHPRGGLYLSLRPPGEAGLGCQAGEVHPSSARGALHNWSVCSPKHPGLDKHSQEEWTALLVSFSLAFGCHKCFLLANHRPGQV